MAPINLKELAKKESKFTSGHRLCTGCGPAVMAKWTMLAAADYNVAMSSATSCVEISSVVFHVQDDALDAVSPSGRCSR